MKTSLSLLVCILFSFIVQSQTPVGKWKFFSYSIETWDGEKTDLLKSAAKKEPCITTIVINFRADGKITTQADNCPAEMQQPNPGKEWKMRDKNKIVLLSDDMTRNPVIFNLEIIGNKMRWTFTGPKKGIQIVKELVAEFIRA